MQELRTASVCSLRGLDLPEVPQADHDRGEVGLS